MRPETHSAMKPQDIAVLLAIVSHPEPEWQNKDLAARLRLSTAEVSKSLQRSRFAGLLFDKGTVFSQVLINFLKHGIRVVFPVHPGRMTLGIPTSHSAEPLVDHIRSTEAYVWPHPYGKVRGAAITPLYASAPEACREDRALHRVLAAVDGLRVGRARERVFAVEWLEETIKNHRGDAFARRSP
jgi:hypothetical protein